MEPEHGGNIPSAEEREAARELKQGYARNRGNSLFEELEPLGDYSGAKNRIPSNIPAWIGEALREARAQCIADPDHDNRNCCRRSHGRDGGRRPVGSDHIHGQADELSRSLGEPFGHAIGVAIVEGDVPAFHVAEVAQSLTESVRRR
jgi:hypothetical protein